MCGQLCRQRGRTKGPARDVNRVFDDEGSAGANDADQNMEDADLLGATGLGSPSAADTPGVPSRTAQIPGHELFDPRGVCVRSSRAVIFCLYQSWGVGLPARSSAQVHQNQASGLL